MIARTHLLPLLITVLSGLPIGVLAQDAGQALRDAQLPTVQPTPSFSTQTPDTGPAIVPQHRYGPFFSVDEIKISGVSLVAESVFDDLKSKALGSKVSITDIDNLARSIDRYYLALGYLSKTTIPEQDITSGTVELMVTEAKLGEISIETKEDALRYAPDRARAVVRNGQPGTGHLNIPALKAAMQVLDKMPGVTATAQLVPSTSVEGTDVKVGMSNTDLSKPSLQIDNLGSRSTGEERVLATLVLEGPFGIGDRLAGIFSKTEGTEMIQLSGSIPAGVSGARLSAFYSALDYRLVDQLTTTSADGSSRSFSAQVDIPHLLFPAFNSTETISFSRTRLKDFVATVNSTDKTVTALSISSVGTIQDKQLFGDHASANESSYQLSLTSGEVDLSGNSANRIADSTTARTHGGFHKLNVQLDRVEPLADRTMLALSLQAQKGFGNLDSSQEKSLGGISGVRAYPTGEASGSSALLGRATLHHQIKDGFNIFGFLDAGWVRLNEQTWSGWEGGNPTLRNEYALYALGAGFNWQVAEYTSVRFDLAHTLGPNPGRDASGNDNDGRDTDLRGWLQLSLGL